MKRLLAPMVHRLRAWRAGVRDLVKDAAVRTMLALRPAAPALPDGRRHVLFIDDLLPDPRFGAGYPRAFEIVHALIRGGYRITMYPMASTRADMARMREQFGNAVTFLPGEGVRGLRRLFWRQGASFDTLLISRPTPMRAWRDIADDLPDAARRAPVIYDAEALLAPRERRRRALFGPPLGHAEYQALLDAELALIAPADAVTAVGHEDADTIRSTFAMPVFMLPHSIAARPAVPGFDARRDFLFVGRLTGSSADSPNVDSLVWFLREAMPLLDTRIGTGHHFHIVGRTDAPELVASDRVILHGIVDDLQPLYDRCRVFIAPTRYAAGIPLKVMEAMGEGIPCVATPLLAHQLGTTPDELPSGEGADAFADRCARLYTDPQAWAATQAAAAGYMARNCSPAMFDRVLGDVLAAVAPSARR